MSPRRPSFKESHTKTPSAHEGVSPPVVNKVLTRNLINRLSEQQMAILALAAELAPDWLTCTKAAPIYGGGPSGRAAASRTLYRLWELELLEAWRFHIQQGAGLRFKLSIAGRAFVEAWGKSLRGAEQ